MLYEVITEAMLNGDVQMAAPSLSKFEQFTKKFRLFEGVRLLLGDRAARDGLEAIFDVGQGVPDGLRNNFV